MAVDDILPRMESSVVLVEDVVSTLIIFSQAFSLKRTMDEIVKLIQYYTYFVHVEFNSGNILT